MQLPEWPAGTPVQPRLNHSLNQPALCCLLFSTLQTVHHLRPRSMACRVLVRQPEIEPEPSTVKAQSPNHWTTREFPIAVLKARGSSEAMPRFLTHRNCDNINVCCFKPLSSEVICYAAADNRYIQEGSRVGQHGAEAPACPAWAGIMGQILRNGIAHLNGMTGTSLVAQWLRICLPVQGTRVRSLVWEDPTCHGATKPVRHDY